MPCPTPEPHMSTEQYLELMLCRACRLMSKEAIESIHAPKAERIGLIQWYAEHLLSDYAYHSSNADKRYICENEAHRLGFWLTKEEKGYSLTPIKGGKDATDKVTE